MRPGAGFGAPGATVGGAEFASAVPVGVVPEAGTEEAVEGEAAGMGGEAPPTTPGAGRFAEMFVFTVDEGTGPAVEGESGFVETPPRGGFLTSGPEELFLRPPGARGSLTVEGGPAGAVLLAVEVCAGVLIVWLKGAPVTECPVATGAWEGPPTTTGRAPGPAELFGLLLLSGPPAPFGTGGVGFFGGTLIAESGEALDAMRSRSRAAWRSLSCCCCCCCCC